MNPIIFTSPRAMTAPLAGTPVLPLIGDDWEMALFASDLVGKFNDGAVVTSAVARGTNGTDAQRTFTPYGGWHGAVLGYNAAPGGKPALLFDGNVGMMAPLYAMPQPNTVVMMVRINSYITSQSGTSRLFSGVTGN